MGRTLTPGRLRFRMNCWPPFLGAGIRVEHIAPDFRSTTVSLAQRWYNRDRLGTHFGASLYAMTDPFFALMLSHNLPPDCTVWDQAGSIEHLAPSRGRLWARLELTDDDLAHIRAMTDDGDKHLHLFSVDVRDDEAMAVARIEKIIYVRRIRRAA